MKKFRIIVLTLGLISLVVFNPNTSHAQVQEMQQLLLDIEKLTQLKSILSDMKTGYQIYQQGYGSISALSQGNFNLHSAYLNGLMAVSPAVRNYGRVAEIIAMQASIIRDYRSAYQQFRQSGSFSVAELSYLSDVYDRLIAEMADNIEELTNVVTANKLRMSDAERIKAIDRIYTTSSDKLAFLRSFNNQGIVLSLQRTKTAVDTRTLKQLYGINN